MFLSLICAFNLQGRFGKSLEKKEAGRSWNQYETEDEDDSEIPRETQSNENQVFLLNQTVASLKACLQKDTTELRLKAIEKRLIQMHDTQPIITEKKCKV